MRKALALCAVAVALLVVGCKKAEDDNPKPATTSGTTAAATQPSDDTLQKAAANSDGDAKDASDSANIRASEDGESVQRRASARKSLGMK